MAQYWKKDDVLETLKKRLEKLREYREDAAFRLDYDMAAKCDAKGKELEYFQSLLNNSLQSSTHYDSCNVPETMSSDGETQGG